MSGSSAADGYVGQAVPSDASTDINAQSLLINRMMNRMKTATLVKVLSVTIPGTSMIGVVDVLPLVNQIDGDGKPTPHGTIYGIPFFRLQGGTNAIIIDPAVGDIGMCCFADRDISSVIKNKGQSNPGSRRKFSMSDGLYIGGYLNGVPTQYVSFTTEGVSIVSPTKITLKAPSVLVECDDVKINGSSLKHNDLNVGSTHVHSDPQGGSTGVPH